MIDRDELYRLHVVGGYSLTTISRRLRVSVQTINRALRHYRDAEGLERWPMRPTPIRPPGERQPATRRLKRGEATLAPLPSLVGQ